MFVVFSTGELFELEINAIDGEHPSPDSAHRPVVDEVIAKMGLCWRS